MLCFRSPRLALLSFKLVWNPRSPPPPLPSLSFGGDEKPPAPGAGSWALCDGVHLARQSRGLTHRSWNGETACYCRALARVPREGPDEPGLAPSGLLCHSDGLRLCDCVHRQGDEALQAGTERTMAFLFTTKAATLKLHIYLRF